MINRKIVIFWVCLATLVVVPAASQDFITKFCSTTFRPGVCKKALGPYAGAIGTDLGKLAIYGTTVSLSQTQSLLKYIARIKVGKDELLKSALQSCNELLVDAVDYNQEALTGIKKVVPPPPGGSESFESAIEGVLTQISVALADSDTCTDGLNDVAGQGTVKVDVLNRVTQLMEYQGLALACIDKYKRK